jgi:branched-chain amino acid transport system substrate-binding protein
VNPHARPAHRRLRYAFVIGIVGALVTACAGSSGPRSAPRRTTTTTRPAPAVDGHLALGALVPVSGPVSAVAPAFTIPVKLAVDEMNLAGGFHGQPVTLTVADDGSTVATGRAALATMVRDQHVDAVVGPSSSEVAAALIPELATDHVVMCSGSNTAGALSALDSGGYYFRTAPPDRLQAVALARLVAAGGARRPFVVAPGVGADPRLPDEVVTALRARGLRPAVATARELRNGPALGAALTRAHADAVVLLGLPTAVAPVLRLLVDQGKGPQQIPTYGNDGLESADLGAMVDPARGFVVAGLRGTTPAGAPAGIDHPFNARLAATGVDPFFSASAYDCTILIGLAARAAATDAADAIRARLPALLTGAHDCSTFADCSALLDRHRSIHYRGAFSRFDRWQRFEPGSGTFDVWTLGLDAHPTLGPPTSQIRVGDSVGSTG